MSLADLAYTMLPQTEGVNRFDKTWRKDFPQRWCRLYVADRDNRFHTERGEPDKWHFVYFGKKYTTTIDLGRTIYKEIYEGPKENDKYDPNAYTLPKRRYFARASGYVFSKEWFVWGLGRFHGYFRFKPHIWVIDYYGGKLSFHIRRDHDGRSRT